MLLRQSVTQLPSNSTQILPQPTFSSSDIVVDVSQRKRYAKGKFLGKGGFAKCYEATDLDTGQVYALKVVSRQTVAKSRALAKLKTEIIIHRTLDHPRIVKFISTFDDVDNIYMVLELCPNQSLNELVKRKRRVSEAEVSYYIRQLVEGLLYLKTVNVIHRDLKLGNLFLSSSHGLKIGDFGLAAKLDFEGQKRHTVCGTPNYIAPEILESHGTATPPRGHSFPVDVWSLGVIMFTMLVGKPPFEDADVKSTYDRIKGCRYTWPENVFVSSAAKGLVGWILRNEPKSRPSLEDILHHPWITNQKDGAVRESMTVENQRSNPLTNTPRKEAINEALNNARLTCICPVGACTCEQPATPWEVGHLMQKDENTRPMNADKRIRNSLYVTTTRSVLGELPSSAPAIVTPRINSRPIEASPQRPVQSMAPAYFASLAPPHHLLGTSNFPRAYRQEQHVGRTAVNGGHLHPSDMAIRGSLNSPIVKTLRGVSGRVIGSEPAPLPGIYIKRFFDYTSKYGVGYILSDGSIGVHFNDNTRISADPGWRTATYVYRARGDRSEKMEIFRLDEENVPSADVKKKLTLIRNFRSYLSNPADKEGTYRGDSSFARLERPGSARAGLPGDDPVVQVKKYQRNRSAGIFQFTNKNWQVMFVDGCECHLTAKVCTYLDSRSSTCRSYNIDCLADIPEENVAKRLHYARSAVYQMINQAAGLQTTPAAGHQGG